MPMLTQQSIDLSSPEGSSLPNLHHLASKNQSSMPRILHNSSQAHIARKNLSLEQNKLTTIF
jgi:hypothetical protein